jgi:hypothetical protein
MTDVFRGSELQLRHFNQHMTMGLPRSSRPGAFAGKPLKKILCFFDPLETKTARENSLAVMNPLK